MSQESKSPVSDERYKERFDFILERGIHYEDKLIADRFSWLLNSQTIFLAAYAILFQLNLPPSAPQYDSGLRFIPLVALFTGSLNYVSILGALITIYRFCRLLDKDFPHYSEYSQKHILGPTLTHLLGQSSPFLAPLGFIGVWLLTLSGLSLSVVIVGVLLLVLVLLWIRAFPYPLTRGFWW